MCHITVLYFCEASELTI